MSGWYSKFLENAISGGGAHTGGPTDLSSDAINVALLASGYTFSAAHEDYVDLVFGTNGIDTPAVIPATISVTGGVFDGGDVTFSAVAGGSTITQIVLYDNTPAADADKQLIIQINSGTGFPLATNGGDVVVQWGANIFSL